MNSGKRIQQLREDRLLKPGDIELASWLIAETNGCSEYYISPESLAEVEQGSVPDIRRLLSLAQCLRVPYEQLLLLFDVDLQEIARYRLLPEWQEPASPAMELPKNQSDLASNFEAESGLDETTLLGPDSEQWEYVPAELRNRLHPDRYCYALIGLKDDSMSGILPPESLVEVDNRQAEVVRFEWRSLRERPLYLVQHRYGYSCCWAEQQGDELTLLPHPLSQHKAKHFKTPDEALVLGKVVNMWVPPQTHDTRPDSVESYLSAAGRQPQEPLPPKINPQFSDIFERCRPRRFSA
jgi:transcriptional regulator with XRE-family HTH domain